MRLRGPDRKVKSREGSELELQQGLEGEVLEEAAEHPFTLGFLPPYRTDRGGGGNKSLTESHS